jgi:hypothetical protein
MLEVQLFRSSTFCDPKIFEFSLRGEVGKKKIVSEKLGERSDVRERHVRMFEQKSSRNL